MSGRYLGWHHKKGASQASSEDLAGSRAVLGELQRQMELGRLTTGTLRRYLPNGTLVEAHIAGGIPQVRITPVGGGQKRRRNYRLFAYIIRMASFDSSTGDGVDVIRLGDYISEDYDGAKFIEATHRMEVFGHIPIGEVNDPLDLAFDNKNSRLYVSLYSGFTSTAAKVYDVKGGNHTLAGTIEYPAYDDALVIASWDKGSRVFIGSFHWTNFTTAVWPDEPTPVPLPTAAPDDGWAVYVDQERARVYTAGAGDITQRDCETLEVLNTFWTFPSAIAGTVIDLEVSLDGAFLYVTGQQSDATVPVAEDFSDMGRYVAKIDLATGALVAKINGCDPWRLSVSPDGKTLAVIDQANGWVWFYDTEAMGSIGHYFTEADLTQPGVRRSVPILFRSSPFYLGYHDLKFAPDGKRLFVTSSVRASEGAPLQLFCLDPDLGTVMDQLDVNINKNFGPMVLRLERVDDSFHED